MNPTSVISLVDQSDNIQASVNLKQVDLDAAVWTILKDVGNHVSGLDDLAKSPDEFQSQYGKPVLAKIAGHTGSGNFESYWALYVSGCCIVLFDEPSSVAEWNKIYTWENNSEFILAGEDKAISAIEEDNDFQVLQEEFLKYACWEDGILFTSDDFAEKTTKASKDEDFELYIFDPDSLYDFDIISEISSIWPLKFKV